MRGLSECHHVEVGDFFFNRTPMPEMSPFALISVGCAEQSYVQVSDIVSYTTAKPSMDGSVSRFPEEEGEEREDQKVGILVFRQPQLRSGSP